MQLESEQNSLLKIISITTEGNLQKKSHTLYDLVMMDIQMPNMDGYKAAQVIRRLPDEDKSNIPIIAMTANAFEEDRQKAFSVGMNAHVSKPIRVDILKSTIESILSGSHQSNSCS